MIFGYSAKERARKRWPLAFIGAGIVLLATGSGGCSDDDNGERRDATPADATRPDAGAQDGAPLAKALGEHCSTDSECASGECMPGLGVCTKPCTQDTECGEGIRCRIVENLGSWCLPESTGGSWCPELCTGGALCAPTGECVCVPHDYTECRDGVVRWIDSCGNVTDKATECPGGCTNGHCLASVGDHCDPNFFQKFCDGNKPVMCDQETGRVTAQEPCGAGYVCRTRCPRRYNENGYWYYVENCTLFQEQGECVPDGLPCNLATEDTCVGDKAVTCAFQDGVLLQVEEDCSANGKVCKMWAGMPVCVEQGVEPCGNDYKSSCVDEHTIKWCVHDAFPYHVEDMVCADMYPDWPVCYSTAEGTACGPPGAELCPPEFQATCDTETSGRYCLNGLLYDTTCPEGRICRISPAQLMTCAQEGAEPCDPMTYQAWCDGPNVLVTCLGSYVERTYCGDQGRCSIDMTGGMCVYE